ncbi:hypothetical protein CL628_04445 [bacterium]|nr:hypothetical protein [bacterium]
MELLEFIDLRIVFRAVHIAGFVVAAGAALFSDLLFMTATKDGKINDDEFGLLKHASTMVWTGLFLAIPSGVGLFSLAPDVYLNNTTFLAKITIFVILLANGVFFHVYHLPEIKSVLGRKVFTPRNTVVRNRQLVGSGVVSMVSWFFVLLLGAMIAVPFGYWMIALAYIGAILVGLIVATKVAKPIMDRRDRKALKKDALIATILLIAVAIIGGHVSSPARTERATQVNQPTETETQLLEESETGNIYSLADVQEHATPKDCWIIIDDLVFDMTEASKFHPARFPNCGGDATENYFENHAPRRVIRDKQMKFLIGSLGDATSTQTDSVAITGPAIHEECEVEDRPGDPTNPRTELFVGPDSWNKLELMTVIEKHCRSLLFIDGTTHEPVARIHDIGHQMHAPTVSNDGEFLYIVARDGIASKIELATLNVLAQIPVGINSRGTGLTDDGKYLLVGNFDPHTAVLIDTSSFSIIKEYEIKTQLNGEEITSRVGGISQKGSKLYVVIKDANQVWVIDTAQHGFPVVAKYDDLGKRENTTTPPLHDIYLTPDGKHLIAAVQDAGVAWVLDTETEEIVAEVPTGKTPHTGPGATVGDLTFVPTLDENGIISVINTTTWKNIKDINTGGPSLFIRHNPQAESAKEYPYVWGETAFGDRHDEIYLINLNWITEGKDDPIEFTLKPVPGESSWHPEFTFDGKFVYVVSMTGDQIVVYDAATIEVVKRIQSGTPSSVINVGSRTQEPGL